MPAQQRNKFIDLIFGMAPKLLSILESKLIEHKESENVTLLLQNMLTI